MAAPMTRHDLLLLARILAETRRVRLITVSKWVTAGTNHLLFDRLARGEGCSTQTLARAERWFRQHWPQHLEWPSGVPR